MHLIYHLTDTSDAYTITRYGVAAMSRLLKIIGLFCRISSLLWGSFAEEICNFLYNHQISIFLERGLDSHFKEYRQQQTFDFAICQMPIYTHQIAPNHLYSMFKDHLLLLLGPVLHVDQRIDKPSNLLHLLRIRQHTHTFLGSWTLCTPRTRCHTFCLLPRAEHEEGNSSQKTEPVHYVSFRVPAPPPSRVRVRQTLLPPPACA